METNSREVGKDLHPSISDVAPNEELLNDAYSEDDTLNFTPSDDPGKEIGIPSVGGCTNLLTSALFNRNPNIYARSKDFLDTLEADFSEEKLNELVGFSKEFTSYSGIVGTSSVVLTTKLFIQEGYHYHKAQEIDKYLNGVGFKNRAPAMFEGVPISTIYARMAIAKIEGVESYLYCGSERLRDVAKAIKKTKVEGPDQMS